MTFAPSSSTANLCTASTSSLLRARKTNMMQTGPVLVEASVALVFGRASHEDSGASPDAVDRVICAQQRLHFEKVKQLFPKGNAGVPDRGP